MNTFQRPVPAWGSVILWAVAIWLGSSLAIGEYSPLTRFGPDKLGHFVEFSILAMLTANALLTCPRFSIPVSGRKTVWGLSVLITAFWGVVDEIHQIWVPTRNSDPFDAIADILGAMVGAWLLLNWIRPDVERSEDVDGEE